MIPVYWKQPYGEIYSHKLKTYLYGYLSDKGPTEVPYLYFHNNPYTIVLAPYTKEWLESKFSKKFPNIRFTYNEIELIPHQYLITLCRLTNTFPKRKNHISLAKALKKTLRNI